MSMRLTADGLMKIVDKVRVLEKVEDVKVRQVEVSGHLVFLDKASDQYHIVGITDKLPTSNAPGNLRGRNMTPAEEYDVSPSRHTIGR